MTNAQELVSSNNDEIANDDWDSSTDHLNEPELEIDPETIDDVSGHEKSEILSEDEFFTDFFCQNLELAGLMTGLSGLSVAVSDGKPETGARESSNAIYNLCRKYRSLNIFILRDTSWMMDIAPIAIFVMGKLRYVQLELAARRKEAEEGEDTNEPTQEAA